MILSVFVIHIHSLVKFSKFYPFLLDFLLCETEFCIQLGFKPFIKDVSLIFSQSIGFYSGIVILEKQKKLLLREFNLCLFIIHDFDFLRYFCPFQGHEFFSIISILSFLFCIQVFDQIQSDFCIWLQEGSKLVFIGFEVFQHYLQKLLFLFY